MNEDVNDLIEAAAYAVRMRDETNAASYHELHIITTWTNRDRESQNTFNMLVAVGESPDAVTQWAIVQGNLRPVEDAVKLNRLTDPESMETKSYLDVRTGT